MCFWPLSSCHCLNIWWFLLWIFVKMTTSLFQMVRVRFTIEKLSAYSHWHTSKHHKKKEEDRFPNPKLQSLLFTAFLLYFELLTDDSIQFPMCEVREKRRERERQKDSGRNGKRDSMTVSRMCTDPCRGGGKLFETGLYSVMKMSCFQTHQLQCHLAGDLCSSHA